MRIAIVITLAACSVFATDKMEKQRNKLAQAIGEANKELAEAQKLRDKKVKRLLSQYVAALKKVQVYWTKKGDLDNALKVRDEIRKVHGLLNPPPICGPLPAMTSDSMVSQKLKSATPPLPRSSVLTGGPNHVPAIHEVQKADDGMAHKGA
jgi:hypothetical protein